MGFTGSKSIPISRSDVKSGLRHPCLRKNPDFRFETSFSREIYKKMEDTISIPSSDDDKDPPWRPADEERQDPKESQDPPWLPGQQSKPTRNGRRRSQRVGGGDGTSGGDKRTLGARIGGDGGSSGAAGKRKGASCINGEQVDRHAHGRRENALDDPRLIALQNREDHVKRYEKIQAAFLAGGSESAARAFSNEIDRLQEEIDSLKKVNKKQTAEVTNCKALRNVVQTERDKWRTAYETMKGAKEAANVAVQNLTKKIGEVNQENEKLLNEQRELTVCYACDGKDCIDQPRLTCKKGHYCCVNGLKSYLHSCVNNPTVEGIKCRVCEQSMPDDVVLSVLTTVAPRRPDEGEPRDGFDLYNKYVKGKAESEAFKKVPECPVCYSVACSENSFLSLQCGHLLCQKCRRRMNGASIRCPKCRLISNDDRFLFF